MTVNSAVGWLFMRQQVVIVDKDEELFKGSTQDYYNSGTALKLGKRRVCAMAASNNDIHIYLRGAENEQR